MPVSVDWDMISAVTGIDEPGDSLATTLCKSCGLCCTGHLFIWAKLRPAELDPAEALGLHVFRSDPTQRGFSHPCPLWKGECTIHASPHYPHICRAYRCKLLKELLAENTTLPEALAAVEQAKGMFREIQALLPASPNPDFRERFVAQLESPASSTRQQPADAAFQQKAAALVMVYEDVFGVDDLLDRPGEG